MLADMEGEGSPVCEYMYSKVVPTRSEVLALNQNAIVKLPVSAIHTRKLPEGQAPNKNKKQLSAMLLLSKSHHIARSLAQLCLQSPSSSSKHGQRCHRLPNCTTVKGAEPNCSSDGPSHSKMHARLYSDQGK